MIRIRVAAAWLSVLLVVPAATAFGEEAATAFSPDITVEDLRAHLEYLASDELRGRETLSAESKVAADYIVGHLARAGATPLGVEGTWFQPYVVQQAVLKEGNLLEVRTPTGARAFEVEKDWNPFSVTASAEVDAPVVFAGYGICAPGRGYDDFDGIDVKGKVILILRKNPGWRERQHAAFTRKLSIAHERGAAAVLLCNDPATTKAANIDRIGHWSAMLGQPAGSGPIPYAFVSQAVARELLASSGKTLEALEETLCTDGPNSMLLPNTSVRLRTALTRTTEENAQNVVGFLPGRDPEVANEVVVVGAHFDHVGLGTYGSLGGRSAAGQIHNGADDNGSGSVTLLELAAWFGKPENRPRRSLVLIAFSGEERGLLGSSYYADKPTVPLDDIVAMVNLDMVGRCQEGKVTAWGVGTGEGLKELVAAKNEPYGLSLSWNPQGRAPSDSTPFFLKKIPVLFFFTGTHKDYHRPTDTADKINYADMRRIALLTRDCIFDLAEREERIRYTQPPPPPRPPIIGIQPSREQDAHGVAVARVTPKGPAAEGGMQEGDVIVSIAGQIVRNAQDLMQVMSRLKAGKTVKVVVLRDDRQMTLDVTLAERPARRSR